MQARTSPTVQNKAKGGKGTDQFERTRKNKIKRIEKELKKHPMTMNNAKMMTRLQELKSGK